MTSPYRSIKDTLEKKIYSVILSIYPTTDNVIRIKRYRVPFGKLNLVETYPKIIDIMIPPRKS